MTEIEFFEQRHQAGGLGRHVLHDPRSREHDAATLISGAPHIATVLHEEHRPVFDQGSLGSCHSADTEILTDGGWVAFPELDGSEKLATVDPATRRMVYEAPTRLIAMPYSGDMYYVSSRNKDFAVTPDHKMVVQPWNEARRTLDDSFVFTDMKDVGWYAGLIANVDYQGDLVDSYVLPGVQHKTRPHQRVDRPVPMAAWLRFLGIYLAEGTVLAEPGRFKVQIAAFKEREKTFVRQVFAELGVHALELTDRFTFEDKQIHCELSSLGLAGVKAPEKFVPRFVFSLAPELLEQLLLGHFMGDGCEQNDIISHYTSSRRLANDLQEIVFLSGKWTTLGSRPPRSSVMKDGREVHGRHPEYRVSCTPKHALSLERKREVRIEHYEGNVYCAEVPTFHTLVTRRNGRILVSGNCTANAALGVLSCSPFWDTGKWSFTEPDAVRLYEQETLLDDSLIPGHYPPTDTGSTGLWSMKALQRAGYITGYRHCFSLATALKILMQYPVSTGVAWYQSMFDVDGGGFIHVDERSGIAGGHQVAVVGVDVDKQAVRIRNSWGQSWGQDGHCWLSWGDWQLLLREHGDVVVPVI